MEIKALGEMGMLPVHLDLITPRSLLNKIKGFDRLERQQWERARIHAHICVSPYMGKKPISITKLWPVPWDKELSPVDADDLKKQAEKAHLIWAEIDKQKAKNE